MNKTVIHTSLHYIDAELNYLKKGSPIALPEWGGFWFMFEGRILVYTKEGGFFDTPADPYKQRNDWEALEVTTELAIQFIKDLRISLDQLSTAQKHLPYGASRELSIFHTEVQWAFMYLGFLLGEVGAANPYPKSFDPSSPVIEKHADKSNDASGLIAGLLELGNETACVKYLRKRMALFLDCLGWLDAFVLNIKVRTTPKISHPYVHVASQVAIHLLNANLMLGQQLNNIRVREEKLDVLNLPQSNNPSPN